MSETSVSLLDRLRTSPDAALWQRHLDYLEAYRSDDKRADVTRRLELDARFRLAGAELEKARSAEYLESLVGTLGADPAL